VVWVLVAVLFAVIGSAAIWVAHLQPFEVGSFGWGPDRAEG
jgi:hypothetical protein